MFIANSKITLLLTANGFIPSGNVLQCKTGQYSTIQYSRAHNTIHQSTQYNTAEHTIQYSTAHNTIQQSTQYNIADHAIQYSRSHNTIQQSTQYNTTEHTIQYNITHHTTYSTQGKPQYLKLQTKSRTHTLLRLRNG